MNMETCKNCGTEFEGKYCHKCGQENITSRLSVSHIVKEATHGIFHWENSILKTFKELLFRPGIFVKSYIEGKRKSFVKPFSYFIFIQTAYVIVFHWLSEKYFAFITYDIKTSGEVTQTAIAKLEEIQHLISSNVNYYNYAFPLIVAIFWRLFLKKKTGINYAESLVAGLYLTGTTLFFGLVLMVFTYISPRIWEARFFVNYAYIIYACIQFSGYTKFKGIIRGFLITFLTYILYILLVSAVTVSYLIIFKGMTF